MRRQTTAVAYFVIACGPAFTQVSKPTFDAVSIRPSSGEPVKFKGGPGTSDPELLTIRSIPLRYVLLRAYGMNAQLAERPPQLFGPAWIETTEYDITATIPPTQPKSNLL